MSRIVVVDPDWKEPAPKFAPKNFIAKVNNSLLCAKIRIIAIHLLVKLFQMTESRKETNSNNSVRPNCM